MFPSHPFPDSTNGERMIVIQQQKHQGGNGVVFIFHISKRSGLKAMESIAMGDDDEEENSEIKKSKILLKRQEKKNSIVLCDTKAIENPFKKSLVKTRCGLR